MRLDEFKIGALVLGAFALFLAANWVIRGCSFKQEGYTVYVEFTSLGGLGSGGDVRMADGIKVGKILGVQMKGDLANCAIYVQRDVKLTDRARITISSSSLFGEFFVAIADLGNGNPLKEGDTLRGEDPMTLMDGIHQFSLLMKNMNTLLGGGESQRILRDVSDSVRRASRGAEDMLARVGKDAETSFRNLAETSARLARLSASLEQATATAAGTLPQALANLKESSDRLASLLRKADTGTGLVATLVNDAQLSTDLRFIVEQLKVLSFKLQRDPSSLIWRGQK